MADLRKLKREMVRQAVRENVELLEGRPPSALRRVRPLRRLAGAAALVVVPLAVFASVNAIGHGPSAGPEVVVVPVHPGATPEPSLESVPWPRPRTIDPTVFRLSVGTVVIDPVHGGSDPGARTEDGLSEKSVTLDVALRLKALLEGASYRVVLTRDADRHVPLRERARVARESGGDLFVSIHVNSIPRPDGGGVETYYLGPTDDPAVRELAGSENLGSGYSLADFRSLLESVYVDVRQSESRRLAGAVQERLVAALRPVEPALADRGVKSAPFVVLIASEMPAVLAEVSSISNGEEARRLAEPAHRQRIAEALAKGLTDFAERVGRSGRG